MVDFGMGAPRLFLLPPWGVCLFVCFGSRIMLCGAPCENLISQNQTAHQSDLECFDEHSIDGASAREKQSATSAHPREFCSICTSIIL